MAVSSLAEELPSKLSNDANAFLWSYSIPGAYATGGQPAISAITVDAAGCVYVIGTALSGLRVTTGVIQPDFRGYSGLCGVGNIGGAACISRPDGFVLKLNPEGAVVYATYIGAGSHVPSAVAVDGDGNAYVAGSSPWSSRAWKLNSTATALLYGAPAPGAATALAVDNEGNLFLAGADSSVSTTTNAVQKQRPWQRPPYFPGHEPFELDHFPRLAFAAKLSANGSVLYSTVLSGEMADTATGIVVDESGNAIVVGTTQSRGFPTRSPVQGPFQRVTSFVAKLNAHGSDLVYSTFAGDNRPFEIRGIILDNYSNPVIAGHTLQRRTEPVFYRSGPESDVFVARFAEQPEPSFAWMRC